MKCVAVLQTATVTITARPRVDGRGEITIAATDTGIGMTDEQMGRLFQKFSLAGWRGRLSRMGRGAGARPDHPIS